MLGQQRNKNNNNNEIIDRPVGKELRKFVIERGDHLEGGVRRAPTGSCPHEAALNRTTATPAPGPCFGPARMSYHDARHTHKTKFGQWSG